MMQRVAVRHTRLFAAAAADDDDDDDDDNNDACVDVYCRDEVSNQMDGSRGSV